MEWKRNPDWKNENTERPPNRPQNTNTTYFNGPRHIFNSTQNRPNNILFNNFVTPRLPHYNNNSGFNFGNRSEYRNDYNSQYRTYSSNKNPGCNYSKSKKHTNNNCIYNNNSKFCDKANGTFLERPEVCDDKCSIESEPASVESDKENTSVHRAPSHQNGSVKMEMSDESGAESNRQSDFIEIRSERNSPEATVAAHRKRFRDFWKAEMREFYEEPWGSEFFDLDAVLDKIPSDPSKWQVDAEDRMKMPDQGSNRFRKWELGDEFQARANGGRCNLCGSANHTSWSCKYAGCFYCGRLEYPCRSCNVHLLRCTFCKGNGHERKDCPDLWRRYHSTTEDTPELVRGSGLKPRGKRWCCYCAKQGHFSFECKHSPIEYIDSDPSVISYQPIYNRYQSMWKRGPK